MECGAGIQESRFRSKDNLPGFGAVDLGVLDLHLIEITRPHFVTHSL